MGGELINTTYNRLLDKCGDSDIINSKQSFVDPNLKFFYNFPLVLNTNERIKEKLANGTSCRGLYIELKRGYHFVKENWEVYMVNTIYIDHIKHIVCMREVIHQRVKSTLLLSLNQLYIVCD